MADLALESELAEELSKQHNTVLIAGCDEAGRGSWAGPLVAAAVILPSDAHLPDITDSKKVKKDDHIKYANQIMDVAIAIGVGIVQPEYIDRFGVGLANKHAIELAIKDLPLEPHHVLIDGTNQQAVNIEIPQTQIVRGDSISLSIASASIIAKTTHDLMMKKYHVDYPHYGWETNTGYGTQAHTNAIQMYGITEHHRRSFKPIREYEEELKKKRRQIA